MNTSAGSAKTLLLLPFLLFLFGILAFLHSSYARTDFPLDDAWIHRVYARALAHGEGFAYNHGQREAGSTSPLWSLLTAPVHWLPGPDPEAPVAAVKGIGLLLALLIAIGASRIAHGLTQSRWIGAVAGSFMAIEPRLLFSALSGMETLLVVALWVWSATALMERRFTRFLLLLGLMPVARPESAVLLPAALAGLAGLWITRRSWRSVATGLLLVSVPSALWVAFCLHATGHPLPNTFYLKAVSFRLGLPEIANAWAILTQTGWAATPLFGVGLVVLATCCYRRPNATSAAALGMLLAAPLLFLISVAGSRGLSPVGYYWTRWVDPASLVFTLAAGLGFALLASLVLDSCPFVSIRGCSPSRPATPRLQALFSSLLLAFFLLSLHPFVRSFQAQQRRLASDSRAIRIMNVEAGRWIHTHTPSNAIVAVNDAGAIRYFGNRFTLDLLGLNNAELAFGRTSQRALLTRADWLAIFPSWFERNGTLDFILQRFEPRHRIRIPLEEYTVTPAESQTLIVIYRKKE